MPSYAVLGATGRTGREVLTQLAENPQNAINAFVRSKSRLQKFVPSINEMKNVKVFEGSLKDIPSFAQCLKGTSVIFQCIGAADNLPGCHIAQDVAHSTVAALCHLRNEDLSAKLPRVLFLSAAPVNPKWQAQIPQPGRYLLYTGLSNVYEDLKYAQEYLRLHQSWLHVSLIQPAGLKVDVKKGHRVSLDRTPKDGAFMSYADLAAGMIEVGESDMEVYDWKEVSIVPVAKDVKVPMGAPILILSGLLHHFAPWTYAWTHKK